MTNAQQAAGSDRPNAYAFGFPRRQRRGGGTAAALAAMKASHALIALVAAIAALSSVLSFLEAKGISEPASLQFGSTLVFVALTFAWFWLDSESRAYRRSPFLSIAVVALGFIAVPYYLIRSRPKGERLKAIGKFVGFCAVVITALIVGSYPGFWLGQYI